jgi:iron complex transport system permease protein
MQQISLPYKAIRIFLYLISLILIASLYGLFSGSVSINIKDLFHLSEIQKQIILHIRFPRIFAAFIVGACLATAGASFQGILQNPLADPYILGVSSGAGLGAVTFFLIGWSSSIYFLPLSSFLGALIATLIVFSILKLVKQFSIVHFILVGIMINAFFSSINFLLLSFSGKKLSGIFSWLMGDLSQVPASLLFLIFIISIIITISLTTISYQINLVSMGDTTARSLGVNVSRLRIKVFFLASILTGIAVSCGGIIGFIGLIIPHLLRLKINDDFRILIPYSFLLGGAFLIITDTISRTFILGLDIPVGVLTSFLGAPFFFVLFLKTNR